MPTWHTLDTWAGRAGGFETLPIGPEPIGPEPIGPVSIGPVSIDSALRT